MFNALLNRFRKGWRVRDSDNMPWEARHFFREKCQTMEVGFAAPSSFFMHYPKGPSTLARHDLWGLYLSIKKILQRF